MVKNLPCNVGNVGSIPGEGTKISHASGQLSPCMTHGRPCVPQLRPNNKHFKKKDLATRKWADIMTILWSPTIVFRQHNGKRKSIHRLEFQGYTDCVTPFSFLFSLTIVQLKIPTFEKMTHVKHLADVPHNSISILWMSCPPLLFRQEKCPKAFSFWFRRIIKMGGSQANIAASFSESNSDK